MRPLVLFLILILAVVALPTHAQDPTTPPRPVISADNWQQLQVVSRIGSGSVISPPLLAPDGTLSVAYNNMGLWLTDPATPDDPPQLVEVGAVTSVAFSPDNRWLAATLNDYDIYLWERNQPITPTPTRNFSTGFRMVRADFSADGEWLITLAGSYDGGYTGYRWSVAAGALAGRITGLPNKANEFEVLGDYWLAYAAGSPYLRSVPQFLLCQFSTGQVWTLGETTVYTHAFEPTTRLFAFAALPSTTRESLADVTFWQEREGQFESLGSLNIAYAEERDIQQLWFSPDGQRLMVESTGYYGHRLQVFDVSRLLTEGSASITEQGNYRLNLPAEAALADDIPAAPPVYSQMGISAGGITYAPLLFADNELLAGYYYGGVTRLDLSQALAPIEFGERWTTDQRADLLQYTGKIALHQADPPSVLYQLLQHTGYNYLTSWSDDGAWRVVLVSKAEHWGFEVQSLTDSTDNAPYFPRNEANSVIISPDGRWLLVETRDDLQLVARDGNRAPLTLADNLYNRLHMVLFSPDMRWLVTSDQNQVWLWSLNADQTVTAYGEAGLRLGEINQLNFSPTAPLLAVAGSNGAYLLDLEQWQAVNEQQRAHRLLTEPASAVAFSPDGTRLAVTPTESGYVYLYEVVE